MERNWDPEIKKFFVKIINSIAWFLFWIISCATVGIYFEMGFTIGQPIIYPIIFYTAMTVTLLLLIRYLYRTWKNG